MNTLAFKIIADYPAAAKELAQALLNVVAGQVADINSAGKRLTLKQLKAIHSQKTAALLLACVRGSGLICGTTPAKIKALTNYARHLGLAFQITDDILDATSTRQRLGKPVGADVKKGFPYLIGVEKSKKMAESERQKALGALKIFGKAADDLRAVAAFVVERKK